MFDQKKNAKPPLFEFDLMKELKNDNKQKELLQKAEKHIQELKHLLRQGADQKVFEQAGTLLQGYAALLKILTQTT